MTSYVLIDFSVYNKHSISIIFICELSLSILTNAVKSNSNKRSELWMLFYLHSGKFIHFVWKKYSMFFLLFIIHEDFNKISLYICSLFFLNIFLSNIITLHICLHHSHQNLQTLCECINVIASCHSITCSTFYIQ